MAKCSCQTDSNSWKMCSFTVLSGKLCLVIRRALHLTDSVKVTNSLAEAQYYLDMMQKKLDDIKKNL